MKFTKHLQKAAIATVPISFSPSRLCNRLPPQSQYEKRPSIRSISSSLSQAAPKSSKVTPAIPLLLCPIERGRARRRRPRSLKRERESRGGRTRTEGRPDRTEERQTSRDTESDAIGRRRGRTNERPIKFEGRPTDRFPINSGRSDFEVA